jgi:hypothetical protein
MRCEFGILEFWAWDFPCGCTRTLEMHELGQTEQTGLDSNVPKLMVVKASN